MSVRTAAMIVLVTVNIVLLGFAYRMGSDAVSDGSGSITTGSNVALSIGATLLVVVGLTWVKLPPGLRTSVRLYALTAQGLHALGHLARLYYTYRWFDDLLHVVLIFGAAVLALRLAQAWDLFPARYATPGRVAVVAIVTALALAGVWEIFEFSMDTLQSSREQDDLTDTMLDMIDGAVGGALAAAYVAARPRRVTTRRDA